MAKRTSRSAKSGGRRSLTLAGLVVAVIATLLARYMPELKTGAEGPAPKGDNYVIKTPDGDTFTMLRGKEQVKVRLWGIDCPEKNQDYGQQARQYTADRIFNKNVTLKERDKDRYGRTVAEVFLPDGTNLNQALVRDGMAWVYLEYNKDPAYIALEAEARRARRGLWSKRNAEAPWEFRKHERERKGPPA